MYDNDKQKELSQAGLKTYFETVPYFQNKSSICAGHAVIR